jgi:hypothetical protein
LEAQHQKQTTKYTNESSKQTEQFVMSQCRLKSKLQVKIEIVVSFFSLQP